MRPGSQLPSFGAPCDLSLVQIQSHRVSERSALQDAASASACNPHFDAGNLLSDSMHASKDLAIGVISARRNSTF